LGTFGGKTKVTVLDVSDHTSPQVAYEVYLDGYIESSRAIGNEIYLVDQNYVTGLPAPAFTYFNSTYIYETEDQYLTRIDGHEFAVPFPHLHPAQGGSAPPLELAGLISDPAQIYEPLFTNANDLLSVLSLDVSSPNPQLAHATSILASYASTVYASPTHL